MRRRAPARRRPALVGVLAVTPGTASAATPGSVVVAISAQDCNMIVRANARTPAPS